MARTDIYLNFQGNAEEAFNFYKSVFKTDWSAPIMRMGDVPPQDGMPQLTDAEKKMVMHVSLPILGGTNIMGTDMMERFGHKLVIGNNTTINLEPNHWKQRNFKWRISYGHTFYMKMDFRSM